MITDEIKRAAKDMEIDLLNNRLQVILIPNPEKPGSVSRLRAVSSRNPEWYRRLCKKYPAREHKKKQSTIIRRECVIRALKEIGDGSTRTEYAKRVIEHVK